MATDTTEGSCIWFTRRFNGHYQHNWISNFYEEVNGGTVEHKFQAAKHKGHPWRQAIIMKAATPGKAKKLGRKWKLTDDELRAWNARKLEVMLRLIEDKTMRSLKLRQKLIETDGPIIEENYWHDNYWGNCLCPKCEDIPGDNYLGKLYEMVRFRWRPRP